MRYVAHTPSASLAPFIERLWALRDAPAHARERIVPSGTLELVINLHADEIRVYDGEHCARYAGAVVSGAYHSYFVIDTRDHASIIGVHFRPGGAAPFLGVPPGELADRHVDLETLWGPAANELRERLCAATSTSAQFALLDAALCTRLRATSSHRAVAVALSRLARAGSTVGDVAKELELSRRRLIEVFTSHVGMTPKRWALVQRFQRAMSLARCAKAPSWGQVAIECGYFDQAHLIHDFRELAGMVPVQLVDASAQVKLDHLALR